MHRHTLDTALQSISASIDLYRAAACSDCLTEEEKQSGSTESSHLVQCPLREAGSSSLWSKVSLTLSCREYLVLLLLAGVPQVKIMVCDLKTCAMCPMRVLELGVCSLASSSRVVSGQAEVQASCCSFTLEVFIVQNSDKKGFKSFQHGFDCGCVSLYCISVVEKCHKTRHAVRMLLVLAQVQHLCCDPWLSLVSDLGAGGGRTLSVLRVGHL